MTEINKVTHAENVKLSEDGCSVIIDEVGENILIIQDIIVKETGLTTDKITVTEIG